MSDTNPRKVGTGRVFAAGTLLALVISVPMVVVILVLHYVVDAGLVITGVGGIATLFVAMGFGYKLSKKLSKVQETGTDLERK
jgi:ABC-type bacteriocin/lantibiotic exporter with double-glycine peptidase domain